MESSPRAQIQIMYNIVNPKYLERKKVPRT